MPIMTPGNPKDPLYEKELIRRVQMNNDGAALKELVRLYRGVFRHVLDTYAFGARRNMSDDDILAEMTATFKNIIKNKIDISRDTQPNTFIINELKNYMQTLSNSTKSTVSRKSTENERLNGLMAESEKWHQALYGTPFTSTQEQYDFIKNEMKRGGEKFTPKMLDHIRSLQRRELSGDRIINSGTEAERLSEFDVMNVAKESAETTYQRQLKLKQIEQIISKPEYTRQQRKFIRCLVGIGEYAARPATNLNYAVVESGMTRTEAEKIRKKVYEELERMG